jgi:hypothetical protein
MLVTLAPGGAGPCRERDFFVYFWKLSPIPSDLSPNRKNFP